MNFFFVQESQEQELEDLRAMLRIPAGRRMFRRLLSAGNVMSASANVVSLWLAERIEASAPGDVARLMQESSNDKVAANAKTAKAVGRRER